LPDGPISPFSHGDGGGGCDAGKGVLDHGLVPVKQLVSGCSSYSVLAAGAVGAVPSIRRAEGASRA
jgi:hypothetical protein